MRPFVPSGVVASCLQNSVPAVESGRDRLTGEGTRGQTQPQSTGQGDRQRIGCGLDDADASQQGSLGEEDEQPEREHQRQQQLFAVAQHGHGLELRLRHDALHPHRSGLPVSSKKTSAND
jgi:hypothetical protein